MQKHRKVAMQEHNRFLNACATPKKNQKKMQNGPQSSIFHEHKRLFEAYLAPKTEHNRMQKHRKVAYAGASSPLKRLCYAKKKAEKNRMQNGYCPIKNLPSD